MGIIPPGNVLMMFRIMIPVVMFDIMESIPFFQDLFPDSEDDMIKQGVSLQQLIDIGYDSYNPILNLGTIFVLLCIYILQILWFVLVVYPLRRLKVIRGKIYFAIKNYLFWKAGWLIFFEGYIELIISARLLFETTAESVDNTPLQWSITYFIISICCVIMPALYIMLFFQNLKALRKSKTFKRRW
jgi:hypothetical protein